MSNSLNAALLPTSQAAMHSAVDAATLEQIAEFMRYELYEIGAIVDAADAAGLPDNFDISDIDAVLKELAARPAVVTAVRAFLHDTIDDDTFDGPVFTVAGVSFMVLGGTSFAGDEPYDGFYRHMTVARFLNVVGSDVPSEPLT